MRYRRALALAILLFIGLAGAGRALADGDRFALLIGNQAYNSSVGVLQNPHNDVSVVGAALKTQGFEILPVVKNADLPPFSGRCASWRGTSRRLAQVLLAFSTTRAMAWPNRIQTSTT